MVILRSFVDDTMYSWCWFYTGVTIMTTAYWRHSFHFWAWMGISLRHHDLFLPFGILRSVLYSGISAIIFHSLSTEQFALGLLHSPCSSCPFFWALYFLLLACRYWSVVIACASMHGMIACVNPFVFPNCYSTWILTTSLHSAIRYIPAITTVIEQNHTSE